MGSKYVKNWIIRKLGGHQTTKEAVQEYCKDHKDEMEAWLTKDLFNAISKEEVLRVLPSGAVMVRGKVLSKEHLEEVSMSAGDFERSAIWKILKDDVKHVANRQMFEKAKDVEDIKFGKAALWVVAVIEEKIKELSNL